ncbi:MAG: hypothetical protein AB1486_31455 [Planctomycetota bacterium]
MRCSRDKTIEDGCDDAWGHRSSGCQEKPHDSFRWLEQAAWLTMD